MTEKIPLRQIRFRKATLDDLDAVVENRIAFQRVMQQADDPAEIREMRRSLRAFFSRTLPNGVCVFYLAEYEGRIIGSGSTIYREQAGLFGLVDGRTGYIFNMFTLPEYRGNGIAKKIVALLIADAKSRGVEKLELHAAPLAEPIYRSFGFVEPESRFLELKIPAE